MNIGGDFASIDGGTRDYRAAYAAGMRWVQIRGAFDYGHQELVDPTWTREHAAAKAAGMKVGPYLFPGWDVGDPSPEDQVAIFAAAVGDLERGVDLVPVLDIEYSKGIAGTGHSRPELMALIRRFVAALRATYGVWPEIYLSGRVWNTDDTDTLGNPPAPDLVDCSPWVAHYAYKTGSPWQPYNPTSPMPPAPNAWGFVWKHQYFGDAKDFPGFSSTVDLTRFINMIPGEVGPRVYWLKRRLVKAGFSPTWDGLKLFQAAHGLVADGIVGLATHTALNWVVL